MPAPARDDVENEILEFLGKGNTDEVTLGTTPQIILIARDFSPEITTTAMWLMERITGFLMHCFTVQLYALPSGQYALHFDLLLPLAQQEDYLVKVRDKNAEIARQAAATQRRQRTCPLLEEKQRLNSGDTLYLVRRIHKRSDADAARAAGHLSGARAVCAGPDRWPATLRRQRPDLVDAAHQMGCRQAAFLPYF